MNYSNTAKLQYLLKNSNCSVKKDVITVLLKMLVSLQTGAVEGINHLCLMNYNNTAKSQYTFIK